MQIVMGSCVVVIGTAFRLGELAVSACVSVAGQ